MHRRLKAWEWYTDPNTFRVFMHLILSANHKERSWRGFPLRAGQVITGRVQLAQELGLSEQQIRTALDKLKSTNEITVETTSQFSVVTLVKWAEYQIEDKETTDEKPADDEKHNQPSTQPITTDKNDKKHKKERKDIPLPAWLDIEAWQAFCKHRGAKFTDRAKELTIRKLEKWHAVGHDTTEILNTSVMNNWSGIFEPKGAKNVGISKNGKQNGHAFLGAYAQHARAIADAEDLADREGQSGLGTDADVSHPGFI